MFNKYMLLVFIISYLVSANTTLAPLKETSYGVFIEGLIQGIQVDPATPSNCVKSYDSISTSYDQLVSTFNTLTEDILFDFISNFNNFVNQFVASYDLCNYVSIADKYFKDKNTALLNFLINAFGNFSLFLASISDFLKSAGSRDYYNMGYYAGEMIRYGLGISL
ncbi:hypothetical protein SteCoe_15641 [Stentor coeruleus]|uniref:Uncharacterized protein n=1 Tax=Stentor coeruleus TaxID=5963 RepID=A0A1R2C356_9CILI|nr:hypothetical protein SteCoe_15641 [Stentor coeruleus]